MNENEDDDEYFFLPEQYGSFDELDVAVTWAEFIVRMQLLNRLKIYYC